VHTEVLGALNGGELAEHATLVVGEGKADSGSGGSNPFSVQMFKPKPKE
jgi:hypothetical protein